MENNYCCDANQCGYGSVQTGACYNVGQKANIGGTLNTCCSAGVWKVGKGDPCAMGFECCSGSCVSSKCA